MAKSIDHTPAKLSPAKGDIFKGLRKNPMRGGLSSPLLSKVTHL